MSQTKPPLVLIVGPTASGKSSFALKYAQSHQCEIVNADSVQVFQSLDIGTAKPSLEERELVPHHLFDFVAEGGSYTAGDYQRDAKAIIEHISEDKSKKLIFVGGSGFYLKALTEGMYDSPKVDDESKGRLKALVDEGGWEAAFQKLEELDPAYAKKVNRNDHYRIGRALEVMFFKNEPFSKIQSDFLKNPAGGIASPTLMVGFHIERGDLRSRIELRTKEMLDRGWIDEVKDLIGKGLSEWAPMKSVGYLQIQKLLKGELPLSCLEQEIITATMQLAKKQMTWFRNQTNTEWFSDEKSLASRLDEL